jgi:hypothetical protein
MKRIDQQFIGYRAEQLAIIRLTDRDDLHMKQMNADYGLDFLVSILRKGKDVGQLFGVQVKGVMSKEKLMSTPHNNTSVANLPFPVLLLVFTMETDEAFWAWLKFPGEKPKRAATELKPFGDAELGQIVDQVVDWYASRSVDVAA